MTEWFTKRAGDVMSQSESDPSMGLIADVPDWVRLPAEIDPARAQLKVIGCKMDDCPKCGEGGKVKHLKLERNYAVAECIDGCGFVWYVVKKSDR